MTLITLVINIVLCACSLAWGYSEAGLPAFSYWILALGLLWLLAVWRRIGWASPLGLFAALLASGLGLWLELSTGWMLAGALFALLAWDLADFRIRLSLSSYEDDLSGIERRHLVRLSLLSLAALGLSSIAMFASLRITFEWILLLALVSALGITHLVRWLKKSG